jgi:hypothetical protein
MHWALDDMAAAGAALSVTAGALAIGLGLRAHGVVRRHPSGKGATVDVVASRAQLRGVMARRPARLVLATDRSLTHLGPGGFARVMSSEGAVLGVLSSRGDASLPEAALAIVRERRVRALSLACGGSDAAHSVAATCAGAALAAGSRAQRLPLEAASVGKLVAEQLATRGVSDTGAAAALARRAFEVALEVLMSVERDSAQDRPRSLPMA